MLTENIRGKRVVMIDDSIVRGTTWIRIVKLLRSAGAREVHMRVSVPPFKNACYFGTDIDSRDNLIACQFDSADQITKGADVRFCDGCFSGCYPINVPETISNNKFEQKLENFSEHYKILE